jgi:hypothetical protein
MIRLLRNNADYVAAMYATELEQAFDSSITSVSSFLSSVYFADETLVRFFANARDGNQIAAHLVERKCFVRRMIRSYTTYRRTEVYEVDAISRLIRQGRPHEQERAFHLLPSEIEGVLETMLELLSANSGIQISFTRKVVPLDYIVFGNSSHDVLIDIRANYDYQTIQGLHVTDDPDLATSLRHDAELLNVDATTIGDQATIRNLIQQGIAEWRDGKPDQLTYWPEMLRTDFG